MSEPTPGLSELSVSRLVSVAPVQLASCVDLNMGRFLD